MGTTDAIVNVKDFGAKGDGSTDDTAALQAAIGAAFGPASAPHGGLSTGYILNRPLFFPNGTYNISAPLVLTHVLGAHIFGSGKMATKIVNTKTSGGALYSGTVFLTQGMSHSLVEHMTLVASAPVAASFTGVISGTTLTVSGVSGTIQPGQALSGSGVIDGSSVLGLSSLHWSGGVVTATASAAHGVPNGNVFSVSVYASTTGGFNGTYLATSTGATTFTYPVASSLVDPPGFVGNYAISATTIVSGSGSTWTVSNSKSISSEAMTATTVNRCFDLAWDGSGDVSLHADTFRNVRFENGDAGCGIGDGGLMGSEILFTACDFVGCTTGLIGFNQNALDFTVLGGSFQGCGRGIFTQLVSTCSYVNGVSFSGSTLADIRFDSYDGMVVEGCNSTSPIFLDLIGSVPMHTKACLYTPAATGSYANSAQASLIMDGCIVTNALLSATTPGNGAGSNLYRRGCNVPGTFLTGSVSPPNNTENI